MRTGYMHAHGQEKVEHEGGGIPIASMTCAVHNTYVVLNFNLKCAMIKCNAAEKRMYGT